MSYCRTHGSFDDYFNHGCPACRSAEERAELDREEMRDALSEIAHTRANPGDYLCPHCRYISLKRDASRCPLCHGEIQRNYWNAVRAQEKADAERRIAELNAEAERKRAMQAAAMAEFIRTAPEREAVAKAAALAEAEKRRIATLKSTAGIVLGSIVGVIPGVIAGIVAGLSFS